MNFVKNGFLVENPLDVTKTIENKYPEIISIYLEANQLAWSVQYEVRLPKDEVVKLHIGTLFCRILNFTQSCYILATRGMSVQASSQYRCSLDPLFQMVALINDRTFWSELEKWELKGQRNALNGYLNSYTGSKSNDGYKRIKAREQDLKRNLLKLFPDNEALRNFQIKTEDVARKAGMLHWYNTMYRIGSADSHSDFKSLESHLVLDSEGGIAHLINEPIENGFDTIVSFVCQILLCATERFTQYNELNKQAQLTQLSDRLEKALGE
ncbi:DUF5677 domain-containing protein [Aliiglaciecola sp. CAU 1673]|uniref:DUF5677 domain-containing protein n=1 Tax=Aliiglaciecola sp. CAU 1673 TaxID=3032595 RepID=UPI0023D9C45D|nr:DUF5677 domain-containing protein [Aliiglaciecola sp. CAU 1673]MDF2176991.1 DUF5677 domain-containing protein [Aliiglaciecola sp. CAU 1673]